MPNQTANYGLIKPLDNETADIAAINHNMDTIDSQLNVIESQAEQNNSELITHLTETATDNVHGLGNRPIVSTAKKTYYINGTSGNDSNDGLSSGTAFKTWDRVLTLIPRLLYHQYEIIIIGNLAAQIYLPGLILTGGYLIIKGNTTTPSNQVVNSLLIRSCLGGYDFIGIHVKDIQFNTDIIIESSSGISIDHCEPRGTGEYGAICAKMSKVYVSNCNFGTDIVQTSICGYVNADIVSTENTGNATRYGLVGNYNSRIGKYGTQPTGTTANEYTSYGSVIA